MSWRDDALLSVDHGARPYRRRLAGEQLVANNDAFDAGGRKERLMMPSCFCGTGSPQRDADAGTYLQLPSNISLLRYIQQDVTKLASASPLTVVSPLLVLGAIDKSVLRRARKFF
jgi:hypothetical protein